MTFYQKLNILSNPLIDGVVEEMCSTKRATSHVYQTIHNNVTHFIKPEVIDALASIGTKPWFLAHFGYVPETPITESLVHTDIYNFNGQWIRLPFGINWDLSPGTTEFNWYSTELEEIYPSLTIKGFRGIHYGSERNRDAEQHCTKLGSLSIERNTPYLVRADIPHKVIYTRPENEFRIGISLRVFPTVAKTWDEALTVFKPLFAD